DYIAASLTEMEIQKSMLIDGLMIKDVDIPKSSRAVLIERDEKFFVPRGSTTLHLGDKVLIISGKNPTEKSPTDSQQK
ncbi:MAG: TrkA C-terminal domain-containing protein, partial [Mucinivorans sp.]